MMNPFWNPSVQEYISSLVLSNIAYDMINDDGNVKDNDMKNDNSNVKDNDNKEIKFVVYS